MLLAALFNFPFDELYRMATRLDPAEAAALAERVVQLYERTGEGTGGPPPTPESETGVQVADREADPRKELELHLGRLNRILDEMLAEQESRATRGDDRAPAYYARGLQRMQALWERDRAGLFTYLFNCLVTGIFVTFGAPFWHRLSKSLLGVRRARALRPERGGS